MNDNNTIDDLDRRAAIAAADITSRAAARPRPAFDPDATTLLPTPRPLASPSKGRVPGRPLLAAAVVVIALIGATVWAVGTRDDGDDRPAQQVNSGSNRPFLAGDGLPAGFVVLGAADTSESVPPASDTIGPLALYGPSASEPRLATAVVQGPMSTDPDAEPVTVRGRKGQFTADSYARDVNSFELSLGDSKGPTLVLLGRGLDRDELARLAAATLAEGLTTTTPAADLPAGWRSLGTHPDGLGVLSPLWAISGASSSGTFLTFYGLSHDNPQTGVYITSESHRSATDPMLLLMSDVTNEKVRGHDATLGSVEPTSGSSSSLWTLRWEERPGEVLTVTGFGLTRDQVIAVAEGLRPAADDEWKDLSAKSSLGDLQGQADAVEIGRGELADGTGWVLRIEMDGDRVGSLDLRVAILGDSSSGSTFSSTGSAIDSEGNPLPAEPQVFDLTSEMETGGRFFAYGLVDPAAQRVEVRGAPGTTPIVAQVVRSHGRAGWVAEMTGTDIGASAEIVAFDADGKELGRTSDLFGATQSTIPAGEGELSPQPGD